MSDIKKIRHSLAHILALAMQELYPDVKFGIGPAIDNGFYYDFELPENFNSKELSKIEKKMREVIKKGVVFEQKQISKKEAEQLFSGQPYKLELLGEIGEDEISTYKTQGFTDLCSGPHIASSKEILVDGFKLDKIAGAYWRGSEKNKMLTRIYGIAFESKKELDEYLKMREEAAKRDHRILGKQLELYAIYPEIGAGLPVWLPKGYTIRKILEDYMIDMERGYGYEHILTPHISKDALFKTSGHLDFYKEGMYAPMKIDEEIYYLKPMNCPMGMMVYKSKQHSYRELPIKMGEFGTVYRYEKSGELSGLARVRGFTQNDAHIFCTGDQLSEQFLEVFEILQKFYKDLGFTNYKFRLGLGDPEKEKFKYCGTKQDWQQAENTIRQTLKKTGVDYYEEKGEAAFYGPKLDVQAVDALGREDSISTIQVDFNLPEKFDLVYVDQSGQKKRPFVIHRALIGSFERFFAFLIEYYAGAFPLWLSPEQIWVLPIGEDHREYAQEVAKNLKNQGFRVKVRDDDNTLSKKIREGEMQKIPYLLIIGDKEIKNKEISARHRGKGDIGKMKIKTFIEKVEKEIKEKK